MTSTELVQDHFEPAVAATMRKYGDFDGVCLASIAVSMKRIADALGVSDGSLSRLLRTLDPDDPESFLRAPINSYGEGIGDAIQGQLVRGQAGVSQYQR